MVGEGHARLLRQRLLQQDVRRRDMYLYEHKLPIVGHGAMLETSIMRTEPSPGAWAADLQDDAA